jgi:hypothetical protein
MSRSKLTSPCSAPSVVGSSVPGLRLPACSHASGRPRSPLLLIDRDRQRFEGLDVGGMIERSYRRQEGKPSFIGIEEFGYGLAVVQELNRKGLSIHRVDNDKVSHALVAVARYRLSRRLVVASGQPPPRTCQLSLRQPVGASAHSLRRTTTCRGSP